MLFSKGFAAQRGLTSHVYRLMFPEGDTSTTTRTNEAGLGPVAPGAPFPSQIDKTRISAQEDTKASAGKVIYLP